MLYFITIVFAIAPFIAILMFKFFNGWRTAGTYATLQSLGIGIIGVSLAWYITNSVFTDVEILNGQITNKYRTHGQYTSTYECNCVTTKNGTVCQTCYEDRYTVTWGANSTVGTIIFSKLDSGSRSVYSTPDPKIYTDCYVGEPASLPHTYTNYMVDSNSLMQQGGGEQYIDSVPAEPKVVSHYKYNRIVDPKGVFPAEQKKLLKEMLDDVLRTLGSKRQVNIIVVFTDILDPMYRYAVEKKWKGANKNEVIVIIGVDTAESKIAWVDTITWAKNYGNELLQVLIRDEIMEGGQLDAANIGQTIILNVDQHYVRPKMKDFEYLKDLAEPPPAATVGFVIFMLIVSGLIIVIPNIKEARFINPLKR